MRVPLQGAGRAARKRVRRARPARAGVKVGGVRGSNAARTRRGPKGPATGEGAEERPDDAEIVPPKGKLDIVA